MKHLWMILLLVALSTTSFAKSAKTNDVGISGTVCEIVDGEEIPVPFANVMCIGTVDGTFAGTSGDFELPLKDGKYTVLISCYGYEPVEKVVKIKKRKGLEKINIVLKSNISEMAKN